MKRETKKSLFEFAQKDRVVYQPAPNYSNTKEIISIDRVKYETVLDKCSSAFVYFLDDDDVLLSSLDDVPSGYTGIIYNSILNGRVIDKVTPRTLSIGYGYARCVFNKHWYIRSVERAFSLGIDVCVDIFLLYDLAYNGNPLYINKIICEIDNTPRTLANPEYKDIHVRDFKRVQEYFKMT